MSAIRILFVFSFLIEAQTIPISPDDEVSQLLSFNTTDEANFTTDISMIDKMPIVVDMETERSGMNLTEKEENQETTTTTTFKTTTSDAATTTIEDTVNASTTELPTTVPDKYPPYLPIKRFMMKESLTVSRTNSLGKTMCLTFYRHTASDDYSHAGICTAGNCYDDPEFVNCRDHFPEKFFHDNPFYS